MPDFQLVSDFAATGDQPAAIEGLVAGMNRGDKFQTLLGATGTGKTAVMAWVIEQVQRPALIMAHNKTFSPITPSLTSSATTTTTSRRPTSRVTTSSSRKRRRSMTNSTACACRQWPR